MLRIALLVLAVGLFWNATSYFDRQLGRRHDSNVGRFDTPRTGVGLVLVDPAVYQSGGFPPWLRPLLATPQMRRLGPLLVRQIQSRGMELLNQAWHNSSRLLPETSELYRKPLLVENWDKALQSCLFFN